MNQNNSSWMVAVVVLVLLPTMLCGWIAHTVALYKRSQAYNDLEYQVNKHSHQVHDRVFAIVPTIVRENRIPWNAVKSFVQSDELNQFSAIREQKVLYSAAIRKYEDTQKRCAFALLCAFIIVMLVVLIGCFLQSLQIF